MELIINAEICNRDEKCVLNLETLILENGLKVEKGLIRINTDSEEKEFCNTYGLTPFQDNLQQNGKSPIVFHAQDHQIQGRYPICKNSDQKDYDVEWITTGKRGCGQACHEKCFSEPCQKCDNYCNLKDAKCCSGEF